MDQEKTAELRLSYGDITAIHPDGAPYFFEMLAGHLAEPWQIWVISGVMDRPARPIWPARSFPPSPRA